MHGPTNIKYSCFDLLELIPYLWVSTDIYIKIRTLGKVNLHPRTGYEGPDWGRDAAVLVL